LPDRGSGLAHRRIARPLRRLAQLLSYLPRFGIETTFVDRAISPPGKKRSGRIQAPFRRDARHPGLDCSTFPRSPRSRTLRTASAGGRHFTTPYLLKPFDHGADLVYHSATKFLAATAWRSAMLVDGGTFDWEASENFRS